MNRTAVAAAWCAIALCTLAAFADGARAPEELDEIIVTATRSEQSAYDAAGSTNVVTPAELASKTPIGAIDALYDEPGVYVQRTTNGQGSPFIRGFTGYHTMLLVDGVRLNNWTFRSGPNQYFNTLNVDDIERIEVVRGPHSVLYGSSALGGVIHARSPAPRRQAPELSLRPRLFARYGSASGDSITGFSLDGGQDSVGFRVGVTRKDLGAVQPGRGLDVHVKGRKFFLTSDDDASVLPAAYRTRTGTVARTQVYDEESISDDVSTAYQETSGSGALTWVVNDRSSVRVAYQGVRQEVSSRWDKVASGEEFERLEYDPQERHLAYGSYTVAEPATGIDRLAATLSLHRQIEGQARLKVDADPATDLSRTEDTVSTVGGSLVGESHVAARHALTYGVDAYADSVASETILPTARAWGRYPDGSAAFDISAFAQDEVALSAAVGLSLGANATYYSIASDLSLEDPTFGLLEKDGIAVTGTVALAVEVVEGVKFHGAVGTGFRAPTIDDLAGVQVTNQGIQAPSPDVDPERSLNLEVGVKLHRPRFGGSIAAFNTFLTDQMVSHEVSEVYGENLPAFARNIQAAHPDLDVNVLDNLDKMVMRGLEADVYVSPAPSLTVYGVGTLVRGEVLTIGGRDPDPNKPWEARVRREPAPNATVGVRWESSGAPYWADVFARGAAKQNRLSNGDIRDPRIPGLTRDHDEVTFDEDGAAVNAGTPGWLTLNARFGATIRGSSRITLAVENAFGRRYRWHASGVDAPGRNFVVGVDHAF
jgi:hemoglobin/transferrin/lactoferrin receptor protein